MTAERSRAAPGWRPLVLLAALALAGPAAADPPTWAEPAGADLPTWAEQMAVDPAIEILDRLPELVGMAALDARYLVDWTAAPAPAGTVEQLRYDRASRTVSGIVRAADGDHPLAGQVLLLLPVPAPAQPIAQGATIAEADLATIEIDLLAARPGLALAAEGIVDRRARRALAPGKPILARDLETVPAVRAREIVTVTATSGPVTVRTKGRALDKGAVGDTVRVQNMESRKVITGVIVEPGQVAVAGDRS
jgi:flagella basal body P-ring formation protein FlgA